MFKIEYKKEENKIYITSNSELEVKVNLYEWETTTDELTLIYNFKATKFNKNTFFYQTNINLHLLKGIKIELLGNDNKIIQEEYIRFRTRYNEIVKKQAIVTKYDVGFGDALTITPIIKKLYQTYNQKISVFTNVPEVFKNNPYVDENIKIGKTNDFSNYKVSLVWNIDNINYPSIDPRQLCAFHSGFQLSEDELDMEFYPDSYIDIPNLPNRYVCINPSVTYTDRTWKVENWQKLIDLLEKHIPVVAIGKLSNKDPNCYKGYHEIKITNGLNLIDQECQNTPSQAYHLISKSKTFVTMDNGLYILSLCTDNHITELATPWNTKFFRKRKGIQNYKLNFIEGDCKLMCTSNLKCSVNEKNSHKIPVFVHHNTEPGKNDTDKWWYKKQCYLNKDTYECHPSPEKVYEEIMKVI